MRAPAALPLTFRPSLAVRAVAVAVAVVCAAAALVTLVSARPSIPARVASLAILAGPVLLGFAVARRRITLESDGLCAISAFRSLQVSWREVLAIEQTRRSFVIITERGDVSAGWIAPDSRDLLFRKTLELARLSLDSREPRWGITARFVRTGEPPVIRPTQIRARPQRAEDE